MKIIAAIDDNYGMMFNHRRVSMDRVVRAKIEELTNGSVLRMNEYTAGQFDVLPWNAVVSESVLGGSGKNDFCFVENESVKEYADKVDSIYLFHWNRRYPSDFKLDYVPDEHGMKLISSEDFAGYSHEKITLEKWVK